MHLKDPLLAPLAAMAAGILCSRIVGFESSEIRLAAPALFLLAAIAKWRGARVLAVAAVLTGVFFAGLQIHTSLRPGPPPELDAAPHETITLSGCVVEPSAFYEDRDQFTLELAPGARAKVSLYVKDGEQAPTLAYGQRIELNGTVRRPRNFQNPGSFDNVRYLARQDIYWTVSSKPSALRTLPGDCGSAFWSAIFGLRTAGLERIERLYPGNPYAIGMLQGILLGETRKLDKIWTEDYRRTNTYHALVISGVHIAVIAGVLLWLLRVMFVPQMTALCITAVTAWLYALVSGSSAPVIRSAGGFTLFLIAKYFYRRGRILSLLAAVALVFLAFDPEQLFDASFQLTFLAVASIGALSSPILDATVKPLSQGLSGLIDGDRDLRFPDRTAQFRIEIRLLLETISLWTRIPMAWLGRPAALLLRCVFIACESALISAMVQLGLALPMALYFHRISFSGLTANLIVVPLMNAVVPIGFLAIFSGLSVPAWVAGLLLRWSQAVVQFHTGIEPDWRVPDPPLWLCLAFVAAILAAAVSLGRSRIWRWTAFASVLALFAVIVRHPFAPVIQKGKFEFTTIDVGQGDAFLLVFPNGATMLVDGGGIPVLGKRKPRMDIGEDVVAPYLWTRSFRKIDMMVGTHLHADHVGGLPALIEDFHPKQLWISAVQDNPEWRAIEKKAKAVGTRIIEMRTGGGGSYGGAEVDVLSPGPDFIPGPTAQNDDSLVLRVTYGKHSFLLMGDASRAIEANIPLRRADVLKAGHHGSKNSSGEDFLQAVKPAWAVITVGADNMYKLPSGQTLDRMAQLGTAIFRTDMDGLITFRTDGRRLEAGAVRANP